ncbi:MAG: hypothetical protein KA354_07745 [Phycisphaerae bacterium]|nr:hypothetical protein [Phycisphaerae bacterium]
MSIRNGYMLLLGAFVVVLTSGQGCWSPPPTPQPQGNEPVTMDDGHKIYNITEDFIAYAEQNANADAATRTAQWNELLEGKYPDFFNQVIYRNLTGDDLAAYKAQIIDQFWNEIVPQLNTLKQTSSTAVQRVLDGRTSFKNLFADFAPQTDYYLTVAFSFHGKAVDLNGQTILALGLENYAPNEPELDITIAHEQYHLYHFTTFSPSGGLYRGVWTEGMAVYASEQVIPGHEMTEYLGFTTERITQMHDLFDDLTQDILNNMGTTDQTIKRAYLGAEDNETWIPPGSGYYIGYYLVQELVEQGNTLATMTRWDADTVYGQMQDTLPTLEQP